MQQKKSANEVVSKLSLEEMRAEPKVRFSLDDIPTIPARDMTPVTVEFVNELRDKLGE